jgi:hypothetical protein
MAFVDRLGTLPVPSADIAIKAPVRVATGANVTLNGLQSIDGITVAAGDRVLLYGQTDARQNGIYSASTGNWTRSIDANGNTDLLAGTEVFVIMGVTNAGARFVQTCTDNPVVIDTSLIGFSSATASFQGLTIRPPGNSLAAGFQVFQFASGTSTGLPLGNSFNLIDMVGDNAGFGDAFANVLEVVHTMGGASMTGGRQTLFAAAIFNQASSPLNPLRMYVAGSMQMQVNSSDNGTDNGTGARGGFFANNSAVFAGPNAKFLHDLAATEFDVFIAAGASARFVHGVSIVGCNAVQGSEADAALAIAAQPALGVFGPHIGWKTGLLFTDLNGAAPFGATSTLVGSYWTGGGTKAAAKGVDLSGFTFSGNAWASTNATISGAGAAAFASLSLTTVLSVANGGTGASTLTAHGVVIGNGQGPVLVTAAGASGTVFQASAGLDPFFTATPTLGVAGSVTGKIGFAGSTSGTVTVQPQNAAGTPLLTLPNASGTFAVSASGNVVLNATTGALTGAANGTTNAMLAQMAASTLKGNNTGGTANAADLTVPQVQAMLGYPMILGGFADGVNANSVGDTAITIACPTANYRVAFVVTQNTGTTASLTTAQYGIFSAVGAGGTAISGAGSALTALTSNAVNTAGSVQSQAAGNSAAYNFTTLYFRITTAQGAAATVNVYIFIQPLP